jgi:hypothetical protein
MRRKILCLFSFLLIMAALAAAVFWPPAHDLIWPAPYNSAPSSEKLTALEQKVATLNVRVDDLGARLDAMASSVSAPIVASSTNEVPAKSSADLARAQSDLVALSAAVSSLQTEMKEVNGIATAARAETQNLIAQALAFAQLRDTAMSGRGFAAERTAFQSAAKSDPDFMQPLNELAPYADKGAPSLAILRQQLVDMTGDIERAMAKASAQNWWERLLAELKGLVSVRPLHGTATSDDALAAMESDLAHDDLAAALDQIKNLPPEAQKTLDDWRANVEARQKIDQALQVMSDHLTVAAPSNASPAQGAP